MTKIKTAQAWGAILAYNTLRTMAIEKKSTVLGFDTPVVIVHGLTEAEVHEAAALLSACRDLGIETVDQLKAKTQPDPRVAVLCEWTERKDGSWHTACNHSAGPEQSLLRPCYCGAQIKLVEIAAQRGEVK